MRGEVIFLVWKWHTLFPLHHNCVCVLFALTNLCFSYFSQLLWRKSRAGNWQRLNETGVRSRTLGGCGLSEPSDVRPATRAAPPSWTRVSPAPRPCEHASASWIGDVATTQCKPGVGTRSVYNWNEGKPSSSNFVSHFGFLFCVVREVKEEP